MLGLLRTELKSIVPGPITWRGCILQVGLGRCPWRVAIASMLLQRTKRVQAESVLYQLLEIWPDAMSLVHAEGLEDIIRPCGLHRNRSRQLVRFSSQWLGDGWTDLRELTGVGPYVSDAVGLICLGRKDVETTDPALLEYIAWLGRNSQSDAETLLGKQKQVDVSYILQ